MMNLIGISGTNGSGKDTVGQILAERHSFLFISLTDMLREELARRNLAPARENMRELSAEWRKKYGLGILVDKAVEVFSAYKKTNVGLAIASLRNAGEADRVHELGGKVVWVDADSKLRYERIQTNLHKRGVHRAVDDQKTFEQFLAEERQEMEAYGDETTLHGAAVKTKADIFIENNGHDLKVFQDEVEKALGL